MTFFSLLSWNDHEGAEVQFYGHLYEKNSSETHFICKHQHNNNDDDDDDNDDDDDDEDKGEAGRDRKSKRNKIEIVTNIIAKVIVCRCVVRNCRYGQA